jgi:hypothetical protein
LEADRRAWALLSWLPFRLDKRDAQPGDGNHFSMLGGLALSQTGGWGLGIALGYSAHFRRAQTPPSWDEVAQVEFDSGGKLPYAWTRHSVLFGAFVDFELPVGSGSISRRVALLGRIMPVAADAGSLKPRDVPNELSTFLSKSKPGDSIADVDLSGFLQAGGRFRVGKSYDLFLLGDLWWLGYDDLIGGGPLQDGSRRRLNYDSVLSAGLSVGIGMEL